MQAYAVTVALNAIDNAHCTIHWKGQAEGDTPEEEAAIAERFISASYPNLTAALVGYLKKN